MKKVSKEKSVIEKQKELAIEAEKECWDKISALLKEYDCSIHCELSIKEVGGISIIKKITHNSLLKK